MKKDKTAAKLPLTHALTWIVVSTFFIGGTSNVFLKRYLKKRPSEHAIHCIIQTGPQREALKTEYLAECIGIASDRPPDAATFNFDEARERLLQSPLISQAEVKLASPQALYIDYTVRRPIAYVEDYENVVLDKEGYLFPFTPFFSPKNLPAIYFGLGPFSEWSTPLKGKYVDLAFDILARVTGPKAPDLFFVKRIDVSHAFADSYGTREIVILAEDSMILSFEGKETRFYLPRRS